jgi:hypothetical protein
MGNFSKDKNDDLPTTDCSHTTEGKSQEFIAPNLTEEEKEILAQLRRTSHLRSQIPTEKRIPITNPDKYSFPLGIDDEGNLNLVKEHTEPE